MKAAAILLLSFGTLGAQPAVTIDPARRFQTIQGFGVNFNGTYFRDAQKPLVDMLIDDLGATIFRLDPYGLSNWESLNDNDDPGVMNWEYYNDRYSTPAFEASWAAARYLNARGIRPFLTLSGIAPDWMLEMSKNKPADQKDPEKPDHLKPAMYDEFAEEVVSMAAYARNKARIDFEYFSPVNETDCPPREGPGITPEEMPKALGAIARRMKREGLGDVQLVAVDQCNPRLNYFGPILNDGELMKQVGAFSLHTYGKESMTPQIERVRNSNYPHVPVWLTEYGDLNDLDFTAGNEWNKFSMTATERALRALNEGVTVALFWDAYDNFHEHDRRITYYGLVKNTGHIYAPKKRYFAAKQLYHFVRPGFQRIGLKADVPGLTVSAFRNGEDGSIVLVGVKRGGADRIRIEATPDLGVWDVYQTTRDLNCTKTDTIKANGTAADIPLSGESIFTLVGKVTK